MDKTCTLCKETKPLEDYLTEDNKERKNCKTCYEHRKKICSKYVENNKEKRKETSKNYREKNREKIRELGKKRRTEQSERIAEISKKSRQKRQGEDIHVKLKAVYRARSHFYIQKIKKATEVSSSNEITYLGCTHHYLKIFLENQFQEGMTWDNWSISGWHIDHIIPISMAENEEEILKLLKYENLRPIWAFENWSKKDQMRKEDIEFYLKRMNDFTNTYPNNFNIQ